MKRAFTTASTLAAFALCASLTARADTLVSGGAIIDYDQAAWSTVAGGSTTPGFEALLLDEAFNQSAANARTSAQIMADEVEASPSYVGLAYAMNGTTVNNLAGRTTQPTTFQYTPGNLTGHSGAIGLGGITRWDVNPLLGGGQLLFGDFTLKYDTGRIALGGSGWHLVGNIAPSATAFDLLNVNITEGAGTFTISGDLGVSYEVANFLYGTPSDAGKDVGNFSFTAVTAVPEPATGLLVLAGAAGLLGRRRTKRA